MIVPKALPILGVLSLRLRVHACWGQFDLHVPSPDSLGVLIEVEGVANSLDGTLERLETTAAYCRKPRLHSIYTEPA